MTPPWRRSLEAAPRRMAVRWLNEWRAPGGHAGRGMLPSRRPPPERNVAILTYHRVNDLGARYFAGTPTSLFRAQMEAMLEHGPALPLEEALARCDRDDLPAGAWCVTFDDGYRDNLEHAAPILASLGIPATLFVVSGAIDRRIPLWHDRIFHVFETSAGGSIEAGGERFDLGEPASRARALAAFLGDVRRASTEERLQLIDRLEQEAGARLADPFAALMTWDEVRAVRRFGFSIGGHTVSHAILSRIPDEGAAAEIAECKREIESQLGAPIALFAYPNGTAADFTRANQDAVRRAGYGGAVTTEWGVNTRDTDRFALRRVGLWGSDPHRASLRIAWTRFQA